MTLSVTHAKTSAKSDDPIASAEGEILPSDWNAAHSVSGNLPTSQLNSGSGATSSTFWRGDGTWAVPATGGNSTLVFDVTQYGWAADGTDHSTEAAAVIAAAAAAGGTIYFPPSTGTYRADSQLLIPNDSGSPQPQQKNIAFVGAGGGPNWYASVGAKTASVLDLRYKGTGAKIVSLGLGALRIENLTIKDGGSSNGTPFVLTTNTVLTCKQNTFLGSGAKTSTVTVTIASPGVVSWTAHGLQANNVVYFTTTGALPTGINANQLYYVSATGLTANSFQISQNTGVASVITTGSQSGTHTAHFGGQDGIILGGIDTALGAVITSPFQGYGTVINGNTFSNMNRGVVGLNYANAIVVTNNSFISNTGTVAIESDASAANGVNQPNTGWVVSGNTIEMQVYTFGVKFVSTKWSTLGPNGFYDFVSATSYYRFEATVGKESFFLSTRNTIISQFNSGDNVGTLLTERDDSFSHAQLTQTTQIGADPRTPTTGWTGSFGSEFAVGVVVKGQRDASKNYPGPFTVIDSGNSTDQISIAIDGGAAKAYIDAYNGHGGFPRTIIINPQGGGVGTGANVRVSKTSDYAVQVVDSSTQFDNLGAGGTVNFTLPTDPTVTNNVGGVVYGFCVAAAHTLQVTASSFATITLAGVGTSASGGNITCSTVGAYIELTNYDTANGRKWVAKAFTGTWVVT